MMALGSWLALAGLGMAGVAPGHLAAVTAVILLASAVLLLTSIAPRGVAFSQPVARSRRPPTLGVCPWYGANRLLALSVVRR
jgi:hypothetical protein